MAYSGGKIAGDSPFRSFWIGGYEGADHRNGDGYSNDMLWATEHLQRIDGDYRRVSRLGIKTVRESIGWRVSESEDGQINLSRAVRMAKCAQAHGLQILWTVMHYGVPHGLSVHEDALIARFARFAAKVAEALAPLSDGPPIYTPINEINFLAWAASETSMMGAMPLQHMSTAEDSSISGYAIKRRLVKAALAGMDAIRRADARARFLHIEPVVHVVAPLEQPELSSLALQVEDYQWQAYDLLSGRLEPELGGSPAALDMLGVNHYHCSQWEVGTERRLAWHLRDFRRLGMQQLLSSVWNRYQRPLLIGETSHIGVGRAAWLHEIAGEVQRAQAHGVPVLGICVYPLLDRPDWNAPHAWHRSGLWHLPHANDPAGEREAGSLQRPRFLNKAYADVVSEWGNGMDVPKRRYGLLVWGAQRWDASFARLQPLLNCMAADFYVVYVEPPCVAPADLQLRRYTLKPTLELVVLSGAQFNAKGCEEVVPNVQGQLRDMLSSSQVSEWIGWIVEGSGVNFEWLDGMPLSGLIYEPDEGENFSNSDLIERSDLVVCKGVLQTAWWEQHHGNVCCVPAGVTASDYLSSGPLPGSYEHEEIQRILQPVGRWRMCFIGSLDERLDWSLIEALALARPSIHIALCGSLLNMGVADLPLLPNVHWLGEHHSSLLPGLLSSCDACILPYHINPSTRWLTSSLLPLCVAAELPIVATPLRELMAESKRTNIPIHWSADAAAFVRACDSAVRLKSIQPYPKKRVQKWLRQRDWRAIATKFKLSVLELRNNAKPINQARKF